MKKKKAQRRRRSMSALDKDFAKIRGRVGSQLMLGRMSPAKREAFDEWILNAPNWSDMTEKEQKACEEEGQGISREEQQALQREYLDNQYRLRLQIGMALKRDDPDSELFQTSKEVVDLFDRILKATLSVSDYDKQKFDTVLDRYIMLLDGEKRKYKEGEANKDDKGKSKKAKRGAPTVSSKPEEVARRRRLKADWERYKETVSYATKELFCKDEGIEVSYLNNSVLRWCRDNPK